MEFVWGMIIESRLFGHVENLKKLTEKMVHIELIHRVNNGKMIYVTWKDVVLAKSHWKYRQRQQKLRVNYRPTSQRWKSIFTRNHRLLSVVPFGALVKSDKFAPAAFSKSSLQRVSKSIIRRSTQTSWIFFRIDCDLTNALDINNTFIITPPLSVLFDLLKSRLTIEEERREGKGNWLWILLFSVVVSVDKNAQQ